MLNENRILLVGNTVKMAGGWHSHTKTVYPKIYLEYNSILLAEKSEAFRILVGVEFTLIDMWHNAGIL